MKLTEAEEQILQLVVIGGKTYREAAQYRDPLSVYSDGDIDRMRQTLLYRADVSNTMELARFYVNSGRPLMHLAEKGKLWSNLNDSRQSIAEDIATKGLTNQELASARKISAHTIKKQIFIICTTLEIASRAQIVAVWASRPK